MKEAKFVKCKTCADDARECDCKRWDKKRKELNAKPLFLWKVERTDDVDYDEYDSFVCVAESKEKARQTHPSTDNSMEYKWDKTKDAWVHKYKNHKDKRWFTGDISWSWPKITKVKLKITKIGTSNLKKPQVIVASYNAG